MKAEMWKAESRNPKALAFHSALGYSCFLLAQFLLASSRLRAFAVSLMGNRHYQRAPNIWTVKLAAKAGTTIVNAARNGRPTHADPVVIHRPHLDGYREAV